MVTNKFDPSDLTIEEQELVLEEYLGIHPDYFIYKDALHITVSPELAHKDKKLIRGFKPKLKQMGIK